MSEEKILALSTQKSIHKPIEVNIDGTIYKNKPLSRATFDEIRKHEKAALGGDIEALYKQVQAMFDVPMDVLNKLDMRDVNSLLDYTMARIFQPSAKTDKEKAEKNVRKPGPDKSA